MSAFDDGGTVFPGGLHISPAGQWMPAWTGMSLLDYAAVHATEEDAEYAAEVWMAKHPGEGKCPRHIARYEFAAMMLEARRVRAASDGVTGGTT